MAKKWLRKASIIASILGFLGGAGISAHQQNQINKIKHNIPYNIIQIEKELNQKISRYEFQRMLKEEPKKITHYFKLLNRYENYINSNEKVRRDYDIQANKSIRNTGLFSAIAGATGLVSLLLGERKQLKN